MACSANCSERFDGANRVLAIVFIPFGCVVLAGAVFLYDPRNLFDDEGRLLDDRAWSGRHDVRRHEQLEALVRPEVDDELLYREAIALGFDRDDPVIFNRLVMNMRFAGAEEGREAADLYREARELGMHLTDIVVRRRLVQRMRLLIESRAAEPEPAGEAPPES